MTRYLFAGCVLGVWVAVTATAASAQDRTRIDLGSGPVDARSIVDAIDRSVSVVPAPVEGILPGPASAGGSPTPGALAPVSLLLRVEFGFASSTLTGRAKGTLDQVAVALMDPRLAQRRFVIEGHTDAIGSDERNMQLSQQRALSVATYLQQRGVTSDRLAVMGLGKSKPLPDMEPIDGRNRRVEIVPLQ